jgi:hypothetical protein
VITHLFKTYGFLNGTELLELLAERILISVPCEASAADISECDVGIKDGSETYPMNSLDMLGRKICRKFESGKKSQFPRAFMNGRAIAVGLV